MLIFKVQDSAYQVQRVNIENTIYQLQLTFNSRDSSWYLDIFDINSSPILQSCKLQWGSLITNNLRLTQFPNGNFYILKTELRDEPITRTNFGADKLYRLVYITNEELFAAAIELQRLREEQALIDESRAKTIFFLTNNESQFVTSDLFYLVVSE
jgi:hypothetical protein